MVTGCECVEESETRRSGWPGYDPRDRGPAEVGLAVSCGGACDVALVWMDDVVS
jgi:hypothetical protein